MALAYSPPPLPALALSDEPDRVRWTSLLIEETKENGLAELRVGNRIDGSTQRGLVSWYHIRGPTAFNFHLRTLLPNQSVFDIGDDVIGPTERVPTPWPETVATTHAIWAACTNLRIDFIGSLSAGKGTHTEITLEAANKWAGIVDMSGSCLNCNHAHPDDRGPTPCHAELMGGLRCVCQRQVRSDKPDEDWRWFTARAIISEAKRILWPDEEERWMRTLRFDQGLIAPNADSQLVRDYGQRKSPGATTRKLLWHEGAGPAPPLPLDRDEAYRMAEALAAQRGGRVRPLSLCRSGDRSDTRWVRELDGKPCPSGPQCFSNEGWPTCDSCPAGS
jgi:hypothetical protein